MMPKMDWVQLLWHIRSDSKLKHLKVIMFSNINEARELQKCRELWITDYILKANVTPAELVERVRKGIWR
jgi:CheY-like chemotaxis protein